MINLHPYQNFDLENLPNWCNFTFNNHDAQFYEDTANEIEVAFQEALRNHTPWMFARTYLAKAKRILYVSNHDPFIYEILGEAFSRLIFYYLFLTKRKRDCLASNGSSVMWQIDTSLLKQARSIAEQVEQQGKRTSDYYSLSADRPLERWVRDNVRPVIESYIGTRAVAPHAHIRVVSTESFAHTWDYIYKQHPYGYYHWDELPYSLPLIIYLDDVNVDDGPYSYVEGSDKFRQNFTFRAFVQAISCKLLTTDDINDTHKQKIASLPRIFRGGEMVGVHLDAALFTDKPVHRVIGPAGTAILSDGFSLVHGGGHPASGRRRALFIAHRYPSKRLFDVFSAVSKKWWEQRMRD